MPVEIGEVDVLAGSEPREQRAADPSPAARPSADDPALALAIARATALQHARDLRLRAC